MQHTKSKSFKRLVLIFILAVFLPCILFLSDCNEVYVSSIEKTGVNGNTSIYTVTYSNGNTSTISVENGKDANITLEDVFKACVSAGIYDSESKENYKKFLEAYIATNVEEDLTPTKLNIYSTLNSSLGIYTAFKVNSTYETTSTGAHGNYRGCEIYAGSGVIYKKYTDYTYIITNSHVVTCYESEKSHKLPEDIIVYPYGYEGNIYYTEGFDLDSDGEKDYYTKYAYDGGIKATFVAYSVDHDLAIIKVPTTKLLELNPDASEITFASEYNLLDDVYAVGNALGQGIRVTKGAIASYVKDKTIDEMPADHKEHTYWILDLDIAIYGGNSGGGLFNSKGELIGIINAGSSAGDNFSFALPVNTVIPCVENLMYYYKNSAGYSTKSFTIEELGVTLENAKADLNEATGEVTYKVTVKEVNTMLYGLDLKAGDVITGIIIDGNTDNGGNPYNITQGYQINDWLLTVRKNSQVSFKITRGEIENTVHLNKELVNAILLIK